MQNMAASVVIFTRSNWIAQSWVPERAPHFSIDNPTLGPPHTLSLSLSHTHTHTHTHTLTWHRGKERKRESVWLVFKHSDRLYINIVWSQQQHLSYISWVLLTHTLYFYKFSCSPPPPPSFCAGSVAACLWFINTASMMHKTHSYYVCFGEITWSVYCTVNTFWLLLCINECFPAIPFHSPNHTKQMCAEPPFTSIYTLIKSL